MQILSNIEGGGVQNRAKILAKTILIVSVEKNIKSKPSFTIQTIRIIGTTLLKSTTQTRIY